MHKLLGILFIITNIMLLFPLLNKLVLGTLEVLKTSLFLAIKFSLGKLTLIKSYDVCT